MKSNLKNYRDQREQFLAEITTRLSEDEHFVACWLTGSFGRNEQDDVSDLDLTVVVAKAYSELFCARHEQVSHKTSEERLALFTMFGTPALVHENNNNAPEGGTSTFVLYSESAIMVDWILIPQSKAVLPHQSHLLFEKTDIPDSPPPRPDDLEQSRKSVAENWAFFWMMMAITIKYLIRDDGVFVTQWIENLHVLVREIERKINREPWKYHRGSISQIQPTREKQIESLRQLCQRMQRLQPKVIEFIDFEVFIPLIEIESMFSLAVNA